MKILRQSGAVIAFLLAATTAWAGTEARIGTGGAPELRIPVGARSTALAGATVANASGVEALFYNPAGIAATDKGTELAFSSQQYIADMDLNFVGVTQKFGDWGSLGLSVKVLSIGEIERTTEESPDGTGETFSPTFSTLGLTYARRLTDRVNFGGTAYYVAEKIMQESATGVAFDFGFQYDTGFRGAAIGLAVKNIGPTMKYMGSDFERNLFLPDDDPQAPSRTVTNSSGAFELPTYFQFGFSYPVFTSGSNRAMAFGAYQNNSFLRDEFRGGLEFMMREDFGLRVGYSGTGDEDHIFGLAYGLGVRVPMGENRKLVLDYSGQSVSDFFDDIQQLSLKFLF